MSADPIDPGAPKLMALEGEMFVNKLPRSQRVCHCGHEVSSVPSDIVKTTHNIPDGVLPKNGLEDH